MAGTPSMRPPILVCLPYRPNVLPFFLAASLAVSAFQPAPQAPARRHLWESPRIHAVTARVLAGDTGAIEAFWKSIDKTPFVEEIPGDPAHRLVTFLWRGDAATKNVVVMSELGGYTDFEANTMLRVPTSDIFHKTYRVKSDARFTYFLAPNDPMTPLTMDP